MNIAMKKILTILTTLAIITPMISSCCLDDKNEGYYYYPNMLVTVKSAEDGRCYFQLDDNTALLPTNLQKSPYKGQVRALANCSSVEGDATPYDQLVKVHWVDSILTKKAVMASDLQHPDFYGKDPVEIVNNWVTVVEDGYLTLQFAALFGNGMTPHTINLIMGVDPENPYLVELRHDAKGDYQMCSSRTGLVAFDISELPDTQGETVKLTVRYIGYNNVEKTYAFDYCTGGIQTAPEQLSSDIDTSLDIQ